MHAPAARGPSPREFLIVGALLAAGAVALSALESAGVWALGAIEPSGADAADAPARCGLRRAPVDALLSWRRPPLTPLILAPFGANSAFAEKTERNALLRAYGAARVRLTSSNSYSEHELAASLAEYVEDHVPLHGSAGSSANESFYLFGPPADPALEALVASYEFPACGGLWCARDAFAASFGLAGARSGVSFHTHGSGFGEVIHGRKRWILYPPASAAPPGFDKDRSTAEWVDSVLPALPAVDRPAFDCVLSPGELLYFPPQWWHATLNLDRHTVFVSSFASDDRGRGAADDRDALPYR